MRALYVAGPLVVLMSLACTLGGPKQSQVCADYLSCLSRVDPDAFSAANLSFGSDGPCWDDADSAESCSTACAGSIRELAAQFSEDEVCGEYGQPLDEGKWEVSLKPDEEGCSIPVGPVSMFVGASGDGASLEALLEVGDAHHLLRCTFLAPQFSCDRFVAGDDEWTLDGVGHHDTAEGTWTLDRQGACENAGEFTAEWVSED